MRMEELSDNTYIKGTDTVERYLLNLVQEYFKTSNIAATTSREYVIKKAVERMKEEIYFDSIGVLSITLPDGEKRTGTVNITLEDLNGEPLISPKLTAFNVDFGTTLGTACEGDDPRLSDARKPLEHQHEISDITGLSGILSTLIAKAERAETFFHKHKNSSLLDILVYTGNKTKIDLTTLDTLEDKIKSIVDEIREDIVIYEQGVDTKINELDETVTQVREEIKTVSNIVAESNKEHLAEAKSYADTKIKDLQTFVQNEFSKFILTTELTAFKEVLNNCFTLVGKIEIPFDSLFDNLSGQSLYSATVPIDDSILQTLVERGQTLQDCQIEIIMSYVKDDIKIYKTLPHIILTDYSFDGVFNVNTDYTNNAISINVELSNSDAIPDEIKECDIIYSVYSKHNTLM